MTKLRVLGPSSVATTRGPGSVKSGLSKMACIVFVFCVAAAIAAPAQTFTTLVNFDWTNGAAPWGPLVQGKDGNFYGTTIAGGINGRGTVFRVTAGGKLAVLYNFCSQPNCADGANPYAGLVQASNGTFYGTTSAGGGSNACEPYQGCGTVFEITSDGKLTTLHSFDGTDGSGPNELVQASNGNLYGTTGGGGSGSGLSCQGCGTVFKITPSGTLTTLHSFDYTDGSGPNELVQASNGNFYGTTIYGGADDQANCTDIGGCGTVFEITPSGALTSLHSFDYTDGVNPEAALVQAANGNFYGTTSGGGANKDGTAFEITSEGKLTTLHSFDGTDGAFPAGALVQAANGNFYGTASVEGGPNGNGHGTVFEITPEGKLTVLHSFDYTHGSEPQAGPVQATSGMFYGTTPEGGVSNNSNCNPYENDGCGTVFSLSVGLAPFVTFAPAARPVGGEVEILGQGFTGATGVSLNGTAASFTVESNTYLTATVPPGATTGSIKVAERGGTLTSNKIFRVTPQISSFSPTSGPVGTSVVITGDSFTGAAEVVFACGKKATFTVDSDTRITASVPAGAMTGAINVVTPGGHVGSTTSFTVTPWKRSKQD
jgi:uncharacterized repeat protein (TIGR03803 family)